MPPNALAEDGGGSPAKPAGQPPNLRAADYAMGDEVEKTAVQDGRRELAGAVGGLVSEEDGKLAAGAAAAARDAHQALASLMRVMKRELWVLKYCMTRMRQMDMVLSILVVGIPVFCAAVHSSMSHLLSEKEDQHYATTVIGALTACHVIVASANRSMRLPEKICDMEKVVKVTAMALNRLEFAQHKPAAALTEILQQVEEMVAHMKMISEHQPPDWAFKLFDELTASGKLPMDLSIRREEGNAGSGGKHPGKKGGGAAGGAGNEVELFSRSP